MNIEEIYLESESDIKNNLYSEAFRKCESILYEDPAHAPAHNSLGWLYKTQFDDYDKAENHFLAAIKSTPLYPHPYFHYASFLTDMERFDDLKTLLKSCLHIVTLEKSWVFAKYATMEELNLNFEVAITYYKKAVLSSLNDEKIKNYEEDIARCQHKIALMADLDLPEGKVLL